MTKKMKKLDPINDDQKPSKPINQWPNQWIQWFGPKKWALLDKKKLKKQGYSTRFSIKNL